MEWNDVFKFGIFRGQTVRQVYGQRPSYLIWLALHHDTKFATDILLPLYGLCNAVFERPGSVPERLRFGPPSLLRDFINAKKHLPGPW